MSIHVSTLRKFIKEEVSRISRQKRKSWLYEAWDDEDLTANLPKADSTSETRKALRDAVIEAYYEFIKDPKLANMAAALEKAGKAKSPAAALNLVVSSYFFSYLTKGKNLDGDEILEALSFTNKYATDPPPKFTHYTKKDVTLLEEKDFYAVFMRTWYAMSENSKKEHAAADARVSAQVAKEKDDAEKAKAEAERLKRGDYTPAEKRNQADAAERDEAARRAADRDAQEFNKWISSGHSGA